jgi:hypothetical protein
MKCLICGVEMTGETPALVDCGGDCAQCMADAGDPDALPREETWGRETLMMAAVHVDPHVG